MFAVRIFYVIHDQSDWEELFSVLTYTKNTSVHTSTNYAQFGRTLSRQPTDLSLLGDKYEIDRYAWTTTSKWVQNMDATVTSVLLEFNM